MLKYYSQKKFTCNKLEWRVYMENQELIMNDVVDIVMFFVKTGKVDAVFLEEKAHCLRISCGPLNVLITSERPYGRPSCLSSR